MSPLDRLLLARAIELAQRGVGDTSPNPPVGAVVTRDGAVLGEGYHHYAGAAHAEVEALRAAGESRGATVYVSLEPCNHVGRTPACTQALIDAGIARVVVGARDPNPQTNGGGIERLRASGIAVDVADDVGARALVNIFAQAIRSDRPYIALKLAMSLDGCVASEAGVAQWLTSEEERAYVRELRIAHDAVMVGAGTVRVDDPQLTVRPPHARRQPYVRIVACQSDTVSSARQIFDTVQGYARAIVLAPTGARENFSDLSEVAELVFVGDRNARQLDLSAAMRALRERGIQSILCEGGPTLGARLIAAKLVDRLHWAIAPALLSNERAVPVLRGANLAAAKRELRFESSERVGDDVVITGVFVDV
jgi:diaminohydroxyphosphoribosylaminopyrimidine deaminase/5-amino-6-(5-phosphoribosylamino)uracil reductase